MDDIFSLLKSLRALPYFSALDDGALSALVNEAHRRVFKADEAIFYSEGTADMAGH